MTLFKAIAFFAILFLSCIKIYSQKQMQYRISGNQAKGIFIDSDDVFEIFIKTTDRPDLLVKAEVEGETFESILLDAAVENGLWHIKTRRAASFELIDDKLAAHKVISVVVFVEIPRNKELWVDSNLSSVQGKGDYSYINLNLSGGDCDLKDFRGSGIVNTLRGRITINTNNTIIEALSRNGEEHIENTLNGNYHLTLKSVDGDISVSQSQ